MTGSARRLRLVIVGLGRLGHACAMAVLESDDLALAGIVRRPETLLSPRPARLAEVPVASHPSELGDIDAALICLPSMLVREAAAELLQHHTPVVEAAAFDSLLREAHWRAIDQMALRRGVAAVVGAGWDPGMRGVFEGLFFLLCPKGGTATHDRPGVSLHHTLAARAIPGVRDALCAEYTGADGATRRYVYVELVPGADLESAAVAIRSDPLFLNEETVVLPVDSMATLEEEGHGVLIERWGRAAGRDHQRFLLEGRFDRVAIAGQMMVTAARALPRLRPGAHALDEIPPAVLRRALIEGRA
jgi:diaminopimelate dehydrogenase